MLQKDTFHLQYHSFCILTSCVQWGFNEITQQRNRPLWKSWHNYFCIFSPHWWYKPGQNHHQAFTPGIPPQHCVLQYTCYLLPITKARNEEKRRSSKLNMMLLGLTVLRILLDKPGSLWYYLNNSIFLHPFSNTSRQRRQLIAFRKHLCANHNVQESLEESWPGRGPKVMLLTSKQRPIYNPQRRLEGNMYVFIVLLYTKWD